MRVRLLLDFPAMESLFLFILFVIPLYLKYNKLV